MKRNKLLVVLISLILVVLVIGAIFAYLFLATDTFKSKQELFAKYFNQNIETFNAITNSETIQMIEKLKNENKYESDISVKIVHSEGGEISNPLNNLKAELKIQKNNEEQFIYTSGMIQYEDEKFFETEIIKENQLYGVRFPKLVKQFVTVNKAENNEEFAKSIGVSKEQLDKIIGILDGNENLEINEQALALEGKYLSIVTKTIEKGVFERESINSINEYSVFLNSENVESMLIEILTNLKNEDELYGKLEDIMTKEEAINKIDEQIRKINEEIEVPTIKITVYEQEQITIKTDVVIGDYSISIENQQQNQELITKIKYFDGEANREYIFEITKKQSEGQENYEIVMRGIEGEEEYTINFLTSMQTTLDNQIKLDLEIESLQGITKQAILIENTINIGKDFEKLQSLSLENNMVLNEINEENRVAILNFLKTAVATNVNEEINLLISKLMLSEDSQNQGQEDGEENAMSQVEINKFNAKFEFYTGEQVSAENVNSLLEVVKNNLKSYEEIQTDSNELQNANTQQKVKTNIKLNIEKDINNEAMVNEVINKIVKNKKYKVSIYYKAGNNLIDYITIEEV